MKLCYEIFHNIFITFCTVRKNVGEKLRKTAKNINFDDIGAPFFKRKNLYNIFRHPLWRQGGFRERPHRLRGCPAGVGHHGGRK